MKKQNLLGCMLAVLVFSGGSALAASASYGFRLSDVRWKEKGLIPDERVSADGVMFGPTFLFRLDEDDLWSVGLDGFYGSMDKLDRADIDLTLGYSISSLFTLFLDARYLDYDYDDGDVDFGTHGFGVGPGVGVSAPLGTSGMFIFANTRVIPMDLTTDVEDADGTAVLWAYEGGLAYGGALDIGVNDTSLYLALGYRHQQMKGGDFDERLQTPFVEVGIRQEF